MTFALLLILAGIAPGDRVRLEAAFSLMRSLQERVWPGWSEAPSGLVLVDGELEFLLDRGEAPAGFAALEGESILGVPVHSRKRTFSPGLLATFPAFGPEPVIVVGTADATSKSSTAWVLTVLHEHFHQLQYADPAYFAETDALDLKGGDETGMWMLTYPFPYDSMSAAFASLSRELARLVGGSTRGERDAFWERYRAFTETLEPADYRYLSLQLWQEGISRYVELRVAELAATEHRVSPAFEALDDYEPFTAAAEVLRVGILDELRTKTMAADGREVFYAFGAALGLLLDQEGLEWRDRYLREKFYLERYRR